jgi:hypothetical protein
LHSRKPILDREALSELAGHEFFLVACADYFAIPNPTDLANVLVSDLPATNNSNLDHYS